jgi:pimeloyl-ACP methyl ester carboxylesterase/DNA-binding CsgD family transcriptional regulator
MELTAILEVAGLDADGGAEAPLLHADSIAAAVFDRTGRLLAESPAFHAMGGAARIEPQQLAAAGAARTVLADPAAAGDETGACAFAYAAASRAASWRLPEAIRRAAEAHPDPVVVVASQVSHGRPLEDACRAHGFSGLQTRVVTAVIRTGSVRTAAALADVSYLTAREAMAEALKRAHVRRIPALVSRLTTLAFGVLPQSESAGVLQDLWGLSARQAEIAVLVAEGGSRAEVAATLRLGQAVVRKELEHIHLMLQVSTAAELARKLVEANALRWLTEATGGDVGFADRGLEPLRFVHRPDGTRIAISDYGPASGEPVLVAHSNLSARMVARGLLRALQAAGYRPIAIDRPGFGLSDPLADVQAGAVDPFVGAARDTLAVLDHLKIRRIDIVARGAAQVILALHRAAPDRLGRVVLVNPAPHSAASGRGSGPISRLKESYVRNPALVRLVIPFYIRQHAYDRFVERTLKSVRGSPADEAAMRDPELMLDCYRSMRPMATGRYVGLVNEVTAMMVATQPAPLRGTADWRVLVGEDDFLHAPERTAAYWREVLPDAQHRLAPGTGRYLALSHPHLVVEALRRDVAAA